MDTTHGLLDLADTTYNVTTSAMTVRPCPLICAPVDFKEGQIKIKKFTTDIVREIDIWSADYFTTSVCNYWLPEKTEGRPSNS